MTLKWSKLDELQMSELNAERVNGNIRNKYSILGATQPIDFVTVGNGEVTTPDKNVTSCCALVNLCDSVVSLE